MPLYEGIGLISEKHAVVLDIGAATTKCGYAGEVSPRCIIPSRVGSTWLNQVTDPESLYALLVEFVHQLYFKWLLVNPKDRRVVVVENILGPTTLKETLARVLFRHYEVSSVLFVPSHLVCLFSLGVNTGLVLDCGHNEATVVPVYEGVPILAAWQAQPLGGAAVQAAVRTGLLERATLSEGGAGPGQPVSNNPDCLTEQRVQDIALRCCFVTTRERGEQLGAGRNDPVPAIPVPLSGSSILLVDGETREGSAEPLWTLDQDYLSLPAMLLDALLKCPLDTRPALARSLVLVGGSAMLPGFRSRLSEELAALLNTARYSKLNIPGFKVFTAPGQPNYTSWLGAAVFGATDVVVTRSLSREQYIKDPVVPDWSNLRFNSVYNEDRQG